LEEGRLQIALERIEKQNTAWKPCKRPTPFSFPIITDRLREKLSSEKLAMNTKVIQIFSQNFELHPSGALYWHEMEMLLIADVHFGKVTHFRKHGSAVPQAVIEQNFKQLNEVLHFFKPKVLTFLGDLFHSYINSEWKLFSEWVSQVDVNMNLISGNHDIISPSKYEELDIHVTQEWKLGLFYLTHEPSVEKGFFNIAGHVHPGVKPIN